EGEAKGKAEGEAKGKAEGILAVLRTRGLEVPEHVRARILGCQDAALLDQWIAMAVTAKIAADVVAGAKS
ncbi:MAG: transposase, partial [Myxococcales bacterium]